MNKYQEALNKLSTMGDKDLYNERHLEWIKTLQELVDKEKSPTLEEVKQEWEALGYEWDEYNNEIIICNYGSVEKELDEVEFNLYLSEKEIQMTIGSYASLSFKIYLLIHKTVHVLGWI